jgi:hypothetical protein
MAVIKFQPDAVTIALSPRVDSRHGESVARAYRLS